MIRQTMLGVLWASFTLCSPAVAQDDGRQVSARPPGASECGERIPENSIQFFINSDFKGKATLAEDVTEKASGMSQSLVPLKIANRTSSIRWNLPPGALVMLHDEGSGAGGDTVVLWGSGEYDSLGAFKFNDKISRWTYFDVGVTDAGDEDRMGPPGSAPHLSEGIARDTVALYKSTKFRSDRAQLDIQGVDQGRFNEMDKGVGDSASAARWSLSAGIVVILFQDADGEGRSRAVWGRGELEALRTWDFNDKASRWAWYDIGQTDD